MIQSLSGSATDLPCGPVPRGRRSRPALVAWCLSAAGHAALLLWVGAVAPSAPRLAAFETLEVMLAAAAPGEPQRPAPRPAPGPAAAGASGPAAAPVEAARDDAGGDRDDSPFVEARHDVAAFHNPKPPYPLAARRRGLQGRVLVAAHVRADGHCAEVRLHRSSGHELLDSAALDTVRRWRFLPARRGDTPVDAWVEVPILFKLDG